MEAQEVVPDCARHIAPQLLDGDEVVTRVRLRGVRLSHACESLLSYGERYVVCYTLRQTRVAFALKTDSDVLQAEYSPCDSVVYVMTEKALQAYVLRDLYESQAFFDGYPVCQEADDVLQMDYQQFVPLRYRYSEDY